MKDLSPHCWADENPLLWACSAKRGRGALLTPAEYDLDFSFVGYGCDTKI